MGIEKKVSQASDNEKCTKSENSWEILITLKLKIKLFRDPLQSNEGDIFSKPNIFSKTNEKKPSENWKREKIGAVDTVKFKACNGYSIILWISFSMPKINFKTFFHPNDYLENRSFFFHTNDSWILHSEFKHA